MSELFLYLAFLSDIPRDMGGSSDVFFRKKNFQKNQEVTRIKCRRDEPFTDGSKDYKYKGTLSGLSLKSETVSFQRDSTLQSLLALLADFLSLPFTLSFFVRCYRLYVFTTILFLTQMPANFSLWKEFTSLSSSYIRTSLERIPFKSLFKYFKNVRILVPQLLCEYSSKTVYPPKDNPGTSESF